MIIERTGEDDGRRAWAIGVGHTANVWHVGYTAPAPAGMVSFGDVGVGACPVARLALMEDGLIYIHRYAIDGTIGYTSPEDAAAVVYRYLGYRA